MDGAEVKVVYTAMHRAKGWSVVVVVWFPVARGGGKRWA